MLPQLRPSSATEEPAGPQLRQMPSVPNGSLPPSYAVRSSSDPSHRSSHRLILTVIESNGDLPQSPNILRTARPMIETSRLCRTMKFGTSSLVSNNELECEIFLYLFKGALGLRLRLRPPAPTAGRHPWPSPNQHDQFGNLIEVRGGPVGIPQRPTQPRRLVHTRAVRSASRPTMMGGIRWRRGTGPDVAE